MMLFKIIGLFSFISFIIFAILGFIFKTKKKKLLILSLLFFICSGICVFLDDPETFTNNTVQNNTKEINDNNSYPKGQDSNKKNTAKDNTKETDNKSKDVLLQWADHSNYMFAVDDNTFDGDVVPPGKYKFHVTSAISNREHIPIVWDIYISENKYTNMNQLQESEYVNSAGGLDILSFTITLKSKQYVYVKYNKTVVKDSGILNIEKIN